MSAQYQESQNDLNDQIDNLHKIKQRLENEKMLLQKEKEQMENEIDNYEKLKINLEERLPKGRYLGKYTRFWKGLIQEHRKPRARMKIVYLDRLYKNKTVEVD